MPIVTIDGTPMSVEPDTLIIQAADRLGIEIPRFCYHPDLRPEGNCRMCLVHIKGFARLTPACSTLVTDDMVVSTAHVHDEVRQATQGVLEFLLINHPLDCPICDQAGECSLQDFYLDRDYGLHPSDVDPNEKVRKRKAITLGPIYMDSERCVMCSRCIRFSNEVSKAGELQFVERGNHVEIQAFEDRALEDPYAGNLADLCPVGALTSRDFRFKRRVWFLHHADSICAGCSTGCNVRIDYTDTGIERVVPRRNPFVNNSWMCDEGRESYHQRETLHRLTHPLRREGGQLQMISWPEALAEIMDAVQMKEPSQAAIVASPGATNETLWLLREWARSLNRPVLMDFRMRDETPDVGAMQDHLLRRSDKAPNTQGALALGLGAGPGIEFMSHVAVQRGIGFALIMHYVPLVGIHDDARLAELARIIRGSVYSVVLTNQEAAWWEDADVVLPLASWAEEEGTYTNHAGMVQAMELAVPAPGDAWPGWRIIGHLLNKTSNAPRYGSAAAVFEAAAHTVAMLKGLTHSQLQSQQATVYPPEGRMRYGQEGFAGR